MVYGRREWVIKGKVNPNALPGLPNTPVLRSLLAQRGFHDAAEAQRHLHPSLGDLRDPQRMKGMDLACQRLARAITERETIGIFSDYDVDGVCSAALLHHFLLRLGCPAPAIFIPDRNHEGYGLNRHGIDELVRRGARLMITADCGMTAADEVTYALEQGLDVIVTDHHEPDGQPPRALCILNPKQGGCDFGDEDLCGAGVIFHLIVGVRSLLREQGIEELPNLRQDLDLVALATVADVVRLGGINRILVKEGLQVLDENGKAGINALSRAARIKGKISAHEIGFILGPRINAAGRMAHARLALELLTTDNFGRASMLAEKLDGLNRQRQAEERTVLKAALASLEARPPHEHVVVAYGRDWHPGVLGIVASRLCRQFSRPAIAISVSDGVGKGSGRSVEGIDLHAALTDTAEHLLGYGGHKMAVGMSANEADIPAFADALEQCLATRQPEIRPVEVDLPLGPLDLNPELIADLDLLAPFGEGNPEPVFMISDMEIVETKKVNGSQTKLILRHSGRQFHTLGCNLDTEDLSRRVDVAFTPVTRNFNGNKYLYLKLKALCPA